MHQALVIGEVCQDILMHNPNTVEAFGQKIWAEDITVTAGGSAAYVALALAHMGAGVRLRTTLGDDEAGEAMLRQLQDQGIDCALVETLPDTDSTKSMVICEGWDKTFIGCSPMLPVHVPEAEALRDVELVFLAGYILYPDLQSDAAYAFLQEASRRGIKLALDAQFIPVQGVDVMKESRMERLFPLCDVFFAARKEVAQLLGGADPDEAGARLLDMGCKQVVLKQGAEGSIVYSKEGRAVVKSFPVEAYDTVGSGDVFGAGYCYAMLRGDEPRACGEFASVFTAKSLERYKQRKNFPSVEQVDEILRGGGWNRA